MSSSGPVEIEDCLSRGGRVVAASDRAARAARSAYDRRKMLAGERAWVVPEILGWKSFVQAEWEERSRDDSIVLSPTQEQELWAEIAQKERSFATLLQGPLHRLAGMAASAFSLVCDYAPNLLREAARLGWQQDAEVFSRWLSAVDERAHGDRLQCAAAIPFQLTSILQNEKKSRPPLLLVGFDRILPEQRRLLDVWGEWRTATMEEPTTDSVYFEAPDDSSELEACALWCGQLLSEDPKRRLLILTGDSAGIRGKIERAILRLAGVPFEFSLGVPLSKAPIVRSAVLALRWLEHGLEEHELDWLLSSGRLCASADEQQVLLLYMRTLRDHELERMEWTATDFLRAKKAEPKAPQAFAERISTAQMRLKELKERPRQFRDCAEEIPPLLREMGWPGYRTLSSEEKQASQTWEKTLDACGSCGFNGKRIASPEFLALLERVLADTVFTPESLDAPIQITGPSESAGLTADAIWFLGADEASWPAPGSIHPLLPAAVQKSAQMPHSSAQVDWDLAKNMTARILQSASKVRFSYARQREGIETRPSSLILDAAGAPQSLPDTLVAPRSPLPSTVVFTDASQVPFPSDTLKGGAMAFTTQSQCPFKAFATLRLAAQSWKPASAGLTPAQRGKILHAALRSIWSGPPSGVRSLDELSAVAHRERFTERHAQVALEKAISVEVRNHLPRRYLELEQIRLTQLLSEWLDFELNRAAFTVEETEENKSIVIGGLSLRVRLDRVDILNDGSRLIVDYKSGSHSPKEWELPRPEDVQLPLYANFCLAEDETPGGLVFATVRRGECAFSGRLKDANASLLPDLGSRNSLVQSPLTPEMLHDWKAEIESLAHDFLQGRAWADPRSYPKTCKACGLQTLCRVQEFPPVSSSEAAPDEDDDGQ